MAKSRLYKFRTVGVEIPFEKKRSWILCKNHYKQVLGYLTFAGEQWDVLKGDKTTEPCYYCKNPDALIDPPEFEFR